MKSNPEKGQAALLVLVAMALFMFGALGLALDVSQLFAHHQMAQVAADGAAEAAMVSIFQGVNSSDPNAKCTKNTPNSCFPTDAPFQCSAYPNSTPCKYAKLNGFGTGDTITVSFPTCVSTPNASCGGLTPNQVQVTISRSVSNGLIRMIGGPALSSIGATGIAGAYDVVAPVPMLVLHPTLDGSFIGDSNTTIDISGGPSRSIQVNSNASDGVGLNNKNPLVDLTKAYLGTGADFGSFGGPSTEPGTFNLGTGQYRQPASPLPDPLLNILAPTPAEIASLPIRTAPFTGVSGYFGDAGGKAPECLTGCDMYLPGVYQNGILIGSMGSTTKSAVFQPGVYVMQGGSGFSVPNTKNVYICGGLRTSPNVLSPVLGCTEDPVTGDGMLVYNQNNGGTGGGLFSITGGANAYLQGTPEFTWDLTKTPPVAVQSRYAGILFFEDRTADSHPGSGVTKEHTLGGAGTLQLMGTIYLTNTVDTITTTGNYQRLVYHGGPCSGTYLIGMIIVDVLQLNGGGCINMVLEITPFLKIRQIALSGGGPHF
jgi:hypothetical protein